MLDTIHRYLRKSLYIDLLLRILQALDLLPLVQQVKQLPAIYFVERDRQVELRIIAQLINDIIRSQQVLPRILAVRRAHHRVCLA